LPPASRDFIPGSGIIRPYKLPLINAINHVAGKGVLDIFVIE